MRFVVNCSQIFCTFAVETTARPNVLTKDALWIALKFFVLLQSKQLLIFFYLIVFVVNCSQIFCTFAVETTTNWPVTMSLLLWIALKFFVLLQSKQQACVVSAVDVSCELLSNFLYFCSRNNWISRFIFAVRVVNCSQIFCTFAVETTCFDEWFIDGVLWIALKFFVLLQSKQLLSGKNVVPFSCELLSNFLYFCSRNNWTYCQSVENQVVNCSQIFCTFAVETTDDLDKTVSLPLWIALKFFVLLQSKQLKLYQTNFDNGCELLSNFLYFCSRNNLVRHLLDRLAVVNCSQIFCTFAVETTYVHGV